MQSANSSKCLNLIFLSLVLYSSSFFCLLLSLISLPAYEIRRQRNLLLLLYGERSGKQVENHQDSFLNPHAILKSNLRRAGFPQVLRLCIWHSIRLLVCYRCRCCIATDRREQGCPKCCSRSHVVGNGSWRHWPRSIHGWNLGLCETCLHQSKVHRTG